MSVSRFVPAAVAAAVIVPLAATVPVQSAPVAGEQPELVAAANAPLRKSPRRAGRGNLLVRISSDDAIRPSVVVDGPRGYRERVRDTTKLTRVPAGWYTIIPRARSSSGDSVTARLSDDRVRVRPRRTTTVRATFRLTDTDNGGGGGQGTSPSTWEAEVIRLTNAARSRTRSCGSEGRMPAVGPVRMDQKLTLAARRHAKDMADHNYFDHDSLDGRDVGDRISAVGYRWSWWGENIAAGQQSPAEVVEAWLDSDGHCSNLMTKAFTEIGVGYAPGGEYGKYWVQDFARPR